MLDLATFKTSRLAFSQAAHLVVRLFASHPPELPALLHFPPTKECLEKCKAAFEAGLVEKKKEQKKGKEATEQALEEKALPRPAPKREREREEGSGLTPAQVKKACTDAIKESLAAKAPLGKMVRLVSSHLLFSCS